MYLKNLKAGKKYIEDIKEDRETKSQKQCGAIFGVLIPAIQVRMTDMGLGICNVAPSQDFVKDILYKCCGGVGEHGENMTLSKMNVLHATKFIDNIYTFCVSQLDGFQAPVLDPNWRDHFPPAPVWSDIIKIDEYEAWLKHNPVDPRITDIEHYGIEYKGAY